jgi:cytochrome c peroxidase
VQRVIAAFGALLLCLQPAIFSAGAPSAAEFFAKRLPLWLPVPTVPPDNPITEEKVQLGRRLFYDTRLSGNGTYSCASCHQQARAFTDGLAHAVGSTGVSHSRSTMSLTNVAYNVLFGWNDRRRSLESQIEVPMRNEHPVEMGLKGHEAKVLGRFSASAADVERFRAAFPGEQPVTLENIVKAIASFERVLVSGNSAFDRYLYRDDRGGMSPSALRGVGLFFSNRLRCSECHGSFNFGGPTIFAGAMPSEMMFHNTGLSSSTEEFRAPTLRNVAVTAPYMHDGSLATLKAVVEHYASGGHENPARSPRVRGFSISPSEKDDVVAFLQSLTDEEFLSNPAFGDPHIK